MYCYFLLAKLQSGLEALEGILGDNCHQPTAVNALMKFNYDVEKALDDILSRGTISFSYRKQSRALKEQRLKYNTQTAT